MCVSEFSLLSTFFLEGSQDGRLVVVQLLFCKIYSEQSAAPLYCSDSAFFFPSVSREFKWFNITVVLITLKLRWSDFHLVDNLSITVYLVPCKIANHFPSRKPHKKDTQEFLRTAGKERTNPWATFFYGLLHMDTSALCGHCVSSRGLTKGDGWSGRKMRERERERERDRVKRIRALSTLWWLMEIVFI